MLEFKRESERFITVSRRDGTKIASIYKVESANKEWKIYSIVGYYVESFHLRQIADKLDELNKENK